MNRRIVRSITAFSALSMTIVGSLNGLQIQPASARAGSPQPRPELNGQLIRDARSGAIFWVENGLARHIPNVLTFTRLFRNQINTAVNPSTVKVGIPLSALSILAKCDQNDAIFLIDRVQADNDTLQGLKKRHITSPLVFNQNRFNPNEVRNIDCSLLNKAPTGIPIK
jgi:hypothetical protein